MIQVSFSSLLFQAGQRKFPKEDQSKDSEVPEEAKASSSVAGRSGVAWGGLRLVASYPYGRLDHEAAAVVLEPLAGGPGAAGGLEGQTRPGEGGLQPFGALQGGQAGPGGQVRHDGCMEQATTISRRPSPRAPRW